MVTLAENLTWMYKDFDFLICLRMLQVVGPFFPPCFLFNLIRYLEKKPHKMSFMKTL